jgi:hypothetical protein
MITFVSESVNSGAKKANAGAPLASDSGATTDAEETEAAQQHRETKQHAHAIHWHSDGCCNDSSGQRIDAGCGSVLQATEFGQIDVFITTRRVCGSRIALDRETDLRDACQVLTKIETLSGYLGCT